MEIIKEPKGGFKKSKQDVLMALLCIAVLLCALIVVRIQYAPLQSHENYMNSDAVWHVLLTVRAMQENPISEHKFLPIVTLQGEENKYIPWSTQSNDSYGNSFYTSFSPAFFIAAYLFFEVTGLPLSEVGLYIFSSLLSLIGYAALLILLLRIFGDTLPLWLIGAGSFLLYFFLPEMLHSNAMVYWAQSLWQPIFLWQLVLFAQLSRKSTKARWAVFFALSFVSCTVEWTGYVANVGFAAIFFIRGLSGHRKNTENVKKDLRVLFAVAGLAVSCVAAFALFLLRFSAAIPLEDLLRSLIERGNARSGNIYKLTAFLKGYWNSFWWLWLMFCALTISVLLISPMRKRFFEVLRTNRALLFASLFPLIENILMMDHANQYTYDRMKAAIPLIVFTFCYLCAVIPFGKGRAFFSAVSIGVVLLLSSMGLIQYGISGKIGSELYRWNMASYGNNFKMASYIEENFSAQESLLAVEGPVRGWAVFCFGRNAYEYSVDDHMVEIAMDQGKRYVIIVVVEENGNQWEKDVYPIIKVIDVETGESKRISVELIESIDPRSVE